MEEDWGIAEARVLVLNGGHTPRPQLGLSFAAEAAHPANGRAALENKLRQQQDSLNIQGALKNVK